MTLYLIRAESLQMWGATTPLYWRDLDGRWTRNRREARPMPREVGEALAAYLAWEGVTVTLEPAS